MQDDSQYFEYTPEISGSITAPKFRGHMIEVAYDYFETALHGAGGKSYIVISLCCLSIEIILKSFNSDVKANFGLSNEKYMPNKKIKSLKWEAHNLISLLHNVEDGYRDYLFSDYDLALLDKHKNHFLELRYGYESSRVDVHHHEVSKLAARTICKMVFLYQHFDSNDIFINNFDVNRFYWDNVQRVY